LRFPVAAVIPRRFSAIGSHRLVWLLLAVVVPPAITLVWLSLRLLDQDRALVAQRDLERRQAAGQLAVHALDGFLAGLERSLDDGRVPVGTVRLTLTSQAIDATPAGRVLWVSSPPAFNEAETQAFAEGERSEFHGDRDGALRVYQAHLPAGSQAVRAGALLRVARVQRAHKNWDAARRTYDTLAAIHDVSIEGMPADLVARRAAISVLAESQEIEELRNQAAALERDLTDGRWLLDRAGWELTVADLERWNGRPSHFSAERRTLSAAADTLWADWRNGRSFPTRRWLIPVEAGSVTAVRSPKESTVTVLLVTPTLLDQMVTQSVDLRQGGAATVTLTTANGERIAGPAVSNAALRLASSETGLPWTLAVNPDDVAWQTRELASRQRLLLLGLASILLLFSGGSFFLWRVVRRELEIARLQTEFVAAVSHEFRTPLTSLSHVTELLQEGDDIPGDRRRSFYDALGRNTERLQRLVESLLDFARMEGGRKPYDLRSTDVSALITSVVADFRQDARRHGFEVKLDADPAAPLRGRVDAGSLTNAVWNLLDNAVKYSPGGTIVKVTVMAHPHGVAIAVSDNGLGVPAHERGHIFQRFVRGRQASELGIKGTGLGLAMVDHIVRAHGGRVELESKEGAGSTFTIVLPLVGAAEAERYVLPEAGRLEPEA
jgi:two-component system, OmpR family, phosphate regulon sensor histidine kinase PhoR